MLAHPIASFVSLCAPLPSPEYWVLKLRSYILIGILVLRRFISCSSLVFVSRQRTCCVAQQRAWAKLQGPSGNSCPALLTSTPPMLPVTPRLGVMFNVGLDELPVGAAPGSSLLFDSQESNSNQHRSNRSNLTDQPTANNHINTHLTHKP